MKKEKEMLIPKGWIPTRVVSVLILSAASIGQGLAQGGSYADSPFGMHPAHISMQDSTYKEARDIGVKWHRPSMYAAWTEVQKNLDSQDYDFSRYDGYYGKIPAGINTMANVIPGNPKADNNYMLENSFIPVDEQKYKNFVKALVERYDGDGKQDMPGLQSPILYWQVGNEPNNREGRKDFAKLQAMSYGPIKEACPECKVVVGGAAQPVHPEYGFTSDKDEYFEWFSTRYEPILQELNGEGFDIFDFHWYGTADGDYKKLGPVYEQMKILLEKYGFGNAPVWITEMGAYSGCPSDKKQNGEKMFSCQTESQQAADYLKRFVYPLSLGIEKIFPAFGLIEGFKGNDGYFDHTGFIYDGEGSNDLGRGVKKLSYYTYKKMVEVLEGSDWNNIQAIQESSGIYIYKFTKQGTPIWVAWNDSSLTRTIIISGISSNRIRATEAVPKYESGKDVIDYTKAFQTDTLVVTNSSVALTLGQRPVFVEPLTVTSVEHESENIPQEFMLYQNYPNPFNPTTNIEYRIQNKEYVSLKVYDVLGREIATPVNGELHAGEHSVQFNAERLPSGIYFYRLTTPTFSQTKSMTVIK